MVFDGIVHRIFITLHREWLEEFAFGDTKLPHDQLLPTFVLYLGKIQNLKQTIYESIIQPDNYIGKNGPITYTLNVTENNIVLDISLRSPNVPRNVQLYDPNNVRSDYSNVTNYGYTVSPVNKGIYKVIVTPGSSSGIDKYTLSVYGKSSDLKKQ